MEKRQEIEKIYNEIEELQSQINTLKTKTKIQVAIYETITLIREMLQK